MKRFLCLTIALLGLPVVAVTFSFGQMAQPGGSRPASTRLRQIYHLPRKKPQSALQQALAAAATGTTIPMWSYSVVSPVDNTTYTGAMVGRSPFFNGHRTTTVQVYLIPVILTFADTGTVFDPTVTDSCLGSQSVDDFVTKSPIFNPSDFVMNGVDVGSAQYIDGFQRGNFWSEISATAASYHTELAVTVLPAQSLTVPAASGQTNADIFSGCPYGLMDGNWWDGPSFSGTGTSQAQNLIAALASKGVGPNSLPLFLFDSVFEYIGTTSNCCVLGYHDSYGTPAQTYSAEGIDTSGAIGGDVSTMSHEIGEWMDDPLGTNPTPLWGHIGQQSACQNNLEVGDPLSPGFPTSPPYNPFLVTMNGSTYTLQELAYYSWFYRQSPSIGSGGQFSDNGTFTTDAGAVCK